MAEVLTGLASSYTMLLVVRALFGDNDGRVAYLHDTLAELDAPDRSAPGRATA